MSQLPPISDDMLDLFAGSALGDLTEEEESRLLQTTSAEFHREADEVARTAAAIHLALHGSTLTPMPRGLRRRVHDELSRRMNDATSDIRLSSAPSSQPVALGDALGSRREMVAWIVTAASLMIAFGFWFSSNWTPQSNLAAKRARLVSTRGTITSEWSAGKTPFESRVSGDVVWNTTSQEGYMRFVNMPVNDPSKEQYQLWIIDPERDDEPVDGGVFDVTSTGEMIIPIQAKLRVIKPVAFAITIEKPGGVVVSTQERLPLLASVN